MAFEAVAAQTFGGVGVGAGAAAAGGSGGGEAVGDGGGAGAGGVGVGGSSGGVGCWGGVIWSWEATQRTTEGRNAGAFHPVPADAAAGETVATSAPAASEAPSARRYVRREIRLGMQHTPWC